MGLQLVLAHYGKLDCNPTITYTLDYQIINASCRARETATKYVTDYLIFNILLSTMNKTYFRTEWIILMTFASA